MIVDLPWNKSPRATSLTIQILIPDSPGLGRVKVGVASNVGAWEVGVRKEATLAIKGRAVTMEALSEEDRSHGPKMLDGLALSSCVNLLRLIYP